jgi:hypothetical protein
MGLLKMQRCPFRPAQRQHFGGFACRSASRVALHARVCHGRGGRRATRAARRRVVSSGYRSVRSIRHHTGLRDIRRDRPHYSAPTTGAWVAGSRRVISRNRHLLIDRSITCLRHVADRPLRAARLRPTAGRGGCSRSVVRRVADTEHAIQPFEGVCLRCGNEQECHGKHCASQFQINHA